MCLISTARKLLSRSSQRDHYEERRWMRDSTWIISSTRRPLSTILLIQPFLQALDVCICQLLCLLTKLSSSCDKQSSQCLSCIILRSRLSKRRDDDERIENSDSTEDRSQPNQCHRAQNQISWTLTNKKRREEWWKEDPFGIQKPESIAPSSSYDAKEGLLQRS